MSGISVLLVIAVAFAIVIFLFSQLTGKKKTKSKPKNYQYRKLDVLFTAAERSFLGVLEQSVGDRAKIFGKVRVADVITPEKGMTRSDWQKAFNKISAKHFDFLLCAKDNLSFLCAIELNDSSHNSKQRRDRDILLENACSSANIPLVQIKAQSAYNINTVKQSIAPYLPLDRHLPLTEKREPVVVPDKSANKKKLCPKCNSTMVKRVAKKGKNEGKEFWACSAFPKCRHVENIKA
jgi:hypothetical protein